MRPRQQPPPPPPGTGVGRLRSIPAVLDGDPVEDTGVALVNLTALAEANRVLLVARFTEFTPATGTQPINVPLTIALTTEQADELAGSLHAHAGYLRPDLVRRPRWR